MLKFKCKRIKDSELNTHAVNEISLIFFNNNPKVNDLMNYLKEEYIKRITRTDFDKNKFNKLILNVVSEFIKDELKTVNEESLWQNTANRLAFAEKVQERIKDIVASEDPEIEMIEDNDLENPLDELPLDKEKMFQFDNGEYLYIDYENGKLFAGSASNKGVFHDYEINYDFDISLDANLEKLYEIIIEDHPEYLATPSEDINDTIENVEVKDDEFEFEDGIKITVSPHSAWMTGAFSYECDIYKNDLYIDRKYIMGVDDAEEAANYAYIEVKNILNNLEVKDSKSISDTFNVVEKLENKSNTKAPKLLKFLFEDEIYNFELCRCKHIVEIYDLLYDIAYHEDIDREPDTRKILKYLTANRELSIAQILDYLNDLYIGKSGEDLLNNPKETNKEVEAKPSIENSIKR